MTSAYHLLTIFDLSDISIQQRGPKIKRSAFAINAYQPMVLSFL